MKRRPYKIRRPRIKVAPVSARKADGLTFASKKERDYYLELKRRRDKGEIEFFLMQVPFLLPGPVRFRIDFMVFYPDGFVELVDVKGMITEKYAIKKKQVEDIYAWEISEV